jgi:hypothetical protein
MATGNNLTPSQEDLEKFNTFSKCMLEKYLKGREEHGTRVVIDPLTEAQKECLDLGCYALMTYYKLEKLKATVKEILK